MSIEHLNLALKIDGLTPTKKFILVALANYADERGTCYPSYKHLAKLVGLKSPKGVQLAIKEFEKLGLLKIHHRRLDNGGYTSNLYELTIGSVRPDPLVSEDYRVGSPQTNNTKEKTKENKKDFLSKVFSEIYKIYPRKVGKKAAQDKFFKQCKESKPLSKLADIKTNISIEKAIYIAVREFNKECTGTEERFIPHLSTWLNQERWRDYWVITEEQDGSLVFQPSDRIMKKRKTLNDLAG